MRVFNCFSAVAAALLLAGCGGGDAASGGAAADAALIPDSVYLTAAPTEPLQSIAAIRANVREGEEVVVRAVAGGSVNPFVADRAIVTIVDDSLPKSCAPTGDHCPTPWDYCCTPKEERMKNMATLRLVDDQGQILPGTIGADKKIKPYSTLIVRGKVAAGSTADNLIIDATQVYVASL